MKYGAVQAFCRSGACCVMCPRCPIAARAERREDYPRATRRAGVGLMCAASRSVGCALPADALRRHARPHPAPIGDIVWERSR